MNDSLIHTFSHCNWSQSFSSEVIKWFKRENVTSFTLSPVELIFGKKVVSLNKELNITTKLNFTFLYAKYYLYNHKWLHGELSVNEFIINLKYKYLFENFLW